MFPFREPSTAVLAGLDMVERAPQPACPLPTWVSIPVRSSPRTGTCTEKTVNLAARIASYAHAGQVVVSEETARRSDHHDLQFTPRGVVDLKGVAEPLPLYQALRRP